MEPGKKTASSLENWLAMLEKAHTSEEYSAVALALPDRKTQDLWLGENGEPVFIYHGKKDTIRLEELIKVADCTDRMMGSRPILTHNNL